MGLLMIRLSLLVLLCLAAAGPARADATLFRVFLVDGTSVVSYGEMARVSDQVIFSMPVGGTSEEPRLHAVTLDSHLVDWPRTDRFATSARYLKYVETRADEDYQRLTIEVAAALNRIAQSSDRASALALADEARRTLADWPRAHYGYRQTEVREIITLLDQAISRLRGTARIELSFVAHVEPVALEPAAVVPSDREQLDQILRILRLTTSARDRVALLQAALSLVTDPRSAIGATEGRLFRRSLEDQLRQEAALDARYARLTEQMVKTASRAAADARIADVERVLDAIAKEDVKLGQHRPEVIQALRGAVEGQLDAARRLRLLRDQWEVRRTLYRDYQRAMGSQLLQLVKAQPALEAIRRLEGPPPDRLVTLRTRLSGGAERLERAPMPEPLRPTHELLVGAWRFAESATRARFEAIVSGNLTRAWEASSAAAGALMMLSRAQQELRALLEPPKLQ